MTTHLSKTNYYRKLFDIIIGELNMDKYHDLYDPELYSENREHKMAILIQQMIMHSMFNNDIETRYNATIDKKISPNDATHYIKSAKVEYTKLMNYINHITNKTTKTHFFVTKYPTEEDPNPDIPLEHYAKELNKFTVTNIKQNREQINETQQNIENIKNNMSEFTDPKIYWLEDDNVLNHKCPKDLIVGLPRRLGREQTTFASDFMNMNIISDNITLVRDEIRFLENKIKCLKKIKEEYLSYDTLCIDLVKNEILLKHNHIKYNLYMKTVIFNAYKVKNLPSDIVNVIREYIGEDYLIKIKQRCMNKKYFPNGREDMKTILKTWKKEDLYNYGQQTFLRYNINTEYYLFRYRKVWIVRSWTKDKMIDYITRNTMICTFPDFQRDVYLITNILKEKRCKKRHASIPKLIR